MKIRHQTRTGAIGTTDLFGTFAALARDEVADFPTLRAHQRHPWHAFLCQCATLALSRAGRSDMPGEVEDWRTLLTGLTGGRTEPWDLVVEDRTIPALLQAPGMASGEGRRVETPDGLDMLLTARNHDLKGARIGLAGDDDWLFALVSLQTQEGQMGAGNYGISRMNGGYGARVGLSLRPADGRPGSAFRRDVLRLLTLRPQGSAGIALVWTEPWDGTGSLRFDRLDPLYVEICRRVRLVREEGTVHAVVGNSNVARIAAKEQKGITCDPWAPILADATKSWGVSERGFSYRRMVDLLDDARVTLPPLARAGAGEGGSDWELVARAVARGQGKTEGFHERRMLVPAKSVLRFGGGGGDRLSRVAKDRQDLAGEAAKILRHAIFKLAQGGPEDVRFDDVPTKARLARYEGLFDLAVDRTFFDAAFWAHVEEEPGAHLALWSARLRDMAREVLRAAEAGLPRGDNRRLRAVARARSVFEGRMWRFVNPHAGAKEDADGAVVDGA